MKTKQHPQPARKRRTPQPPAPPTLPPAAERRLYTDFLALAFYPGMHRPGPAHAA